MHLISKSGVFSLEFYSKYKDIDFPFIKLTQLEKDNEI